MKTLIGLTLGTVLALGTAAASASGASGAAPAKEPPAGIEVIVVTAKRPATQSAEPIYEVIVTAKRPAYLNTNQTPAPVAPAMAIDAPKLKLAVSDSVVRL